MSRTAIALVLVVAVGIGLRLGFASGFVDFDDRHYVERARQIAIGESAAATPHQGTRPGMILPTAAMFALWGVAVPAVMVVSLACSVVGMLAVFGFGRVLFDTRVGLAAAALLALFPLDVIFATTLSPTAPIGLFAGMAVLLFAVAERDRRAALAAAAGASLGAAFTFGETPLFLFLAYALWAVTIGRPARRHLAALGGFAAVVAAEMVAMAVATGDPVARFAALAGADTVRGVNLDVAHAGWTSEWITHPLLRVASEQELGLYLVLGLPLAAWRLARSTVSAERLLALVVIVAFAWISWGTVSPFAYAPLARLPRYLALLQMPLVLLLALWLLRMTSAAPRRAAALAAAIAVTALLCVVVDGSRWRSHGYAQVRDLIASRRPTRVVVEASLLMPFLFFEGYEPAIPVAVLSADAAGPRVVERDGDRPGERPAALATPGTYVVARERALRRWLGGQDALTLVERFPPPDTPYRRLLRNAAVRQLLALARSPYRMRELEESATARDTIAVYAAR